LFYFTGSTQVAKPLARCGQFIHSSKLPRGTFYGPRRALKIARKN
jgi:hypothetical protein